MLWHHHGHLLFFLRNSGLFAAISIEVNRISIQQADIKRLIIICPGFILKRNLLCTNFWFSLCSLMHYRS